MIFEGKMRFCIAKPKNSIGGETDLMLGSVDEYFVTLAVIYMYMYSGFKRDKEDTPSWALEQYFNSAYLHVRYAHNVTESLKMSPLFGSSAA